MGSALSSPATPTMTEQNIGDQFGKVFIVTGATSGVGRKLAEILYAANARVWITARSQSKAAQTIDAIHKAAPTSRGLLKVINVDFNDLTTIKPATETFLQQESTLDVLWNNAGIMIPPKGTQTIQSYEAQIGVNVLAPFLFTTLLIETLVKTATISRSVSPRVVWVSSSAAGRFSPPGGVDISALDSTAKYSQWQYYGISKAANILLASQFAYKYGDKGIISVSTDPGNLDTNLYKDMPNWQHIIARKFALKPAIYGAYTELFAGLSNTITSQENGAWVTPWGTIAEPRRDIVEACKPTGQNTAELLWKWCEKAVHQYI